VLEVKNLRISFSDNGGDEAVDGISFSMEQGEMLGVVGESGSGKTVTALTIAGLIDRRKVITSGEIIFRGKELLGASRDELRKIQGRAIGVIFQEAMTSLNPLMKVGKQIEEALKIHTKMTPEVRRELALEAMQQVELPEPELSYEKYPHQLSGGQRQRAMIASAYISGPKLLILDEPTTALDVTVQAQILNLLGKINRERNMSMLFISHDLRVVRRVCSRVIVMHRGKIVEQGDVNEVFDNPQHEYTKKLIAAIPTRRKKNG